MNEVWKGFAGLFAVFFLAGYLFLWDSTSEHEHALVYESDPILKAEEAFQEANYSFYRIWYRRADETGKVYGYWLITAGDKIEKTILEKYPERYDFQESKHFGNTHEQAHFNKRAKKWSIAYNLHLRDLISEAAKRDAHDL